MECLRLSDAAGDGTEMGPSDAELPLGDRCCAALLACCTGAFFTASASRAADIYAFLLAGSVARVVLRFPHAFGLASPLPVGRAKATAVARDALLLAVISPEVDDTVANAVRSAAGDAVQCAYLARLDAGCGGEDEENALYEAAVEALGEAVSAPQPLAPRAQEAGAQKAADAAAAPAYALLRLTARLVNRVDTPARCVRGVAPCAAPSRLAPSQPYPGRVARISEAAAPAGARLRAGVPPL